MREGGTWPTLANFFLLSPFLIVFFLSLSATFFSFMENYWESPICCSDWNCCDFAGSNTAIVNLTTKCGGRYVWPSLANFFFFALAFLIDLFSSLSAICFPFKENYWESPICCSDWNCYDFTDSNTAIEENGKCWRKMDGFSAVGRHHNYVKCFNLNSKLEILNNFPWI